MEQVDVNNNIIGRDEPENTKDTGRNPDGTWKKGFCPNPGGRGKNPLKEFSLKDFNSWTDEQKKEFLDKISPFDRWRMTEGNPQNSTDLTSDGNPLFNEETKQKTQKAIKEVIGSRDTGRGEDTGN